MLRKILVSDNERVLVIRKRRFENILGPGEYWIFAFGVELVRFDISGLVFVNEWADFIVTQKPELAAHYFTVVETTDAQVAVVYLDGKVARVIAPAKRVLFWRGAVEVTFALI